MVEDTYDGPTTAKLQLAYWPMSENFKFKLWQVIAKLQTDQQRYANKAYVPLASIATATVVRGVKWHNCAAAKVLSPCCRSVQLHYSTRKLQGWDLGELGGPTPLGVPMISLTLQV